MNTEAPSIDARDDFRPVATVYRRRKRLASFVVLPIFAFTGLAMFFLPFVYVIASGVCFVVVAVVADAFTPKLDCPVCRKKADAELV
jgi:hypothetical protein